MKSAIKELIERIEQQIELSAHNKLGTNRTGDYRIGLNKALQLAFDALETEKQQIIDAANQDEFETLGGVTKGEYYYFKNYKKD